MPLYMNGVKIPLEARFPDGTFAMKIVPDTVHPLSNTAVLRWNYKDESECVALRFIVEHLRTHGIDEIILEMPYIPNARLDRVQKHDEVFTLKYFAKMLNEMKFSEVRVLDPHSNVSAAVIENIVISSPKEYIDKAISDINDPDLFMFYPDEGAMKRYSKMVERPYGFGIKRRDWSTGKILSYDIVGAEDVKGKNVLVVDDICSRGGTFLNAAKALKRAGAEKIYLYCSHCEDTIFSGELLDGDLIERVYTTNSIFSCHSGMKIVVFDWNY